MRIRANAGQIAAAFETSRRREVLSFKHHVEVVSLPEEWQDKLLDEAEALLAEKALAAPRHGHTLAWRSRDDT